MRAQDLNGWKNYPTKWWAERLLNVRWKDDVISAARQARTIEGFRQANLAALTPEPGELHDWAEQFVDWHALWLFFKGGAEKVPSKAARNLNRRAA